MRNTHLLVIDPQNDFCDIPLTCRPLNAQGLTETPALAIPGSHQRMLNLARYICKNASAIEAITVTLDSHPNIAIERPSAWQTGQGAEVAPFTTISIDDIEKGVVTPKFHPALLTEQVRRLALQDENLMIWPTHCVIGTWGHNIHADIAKAIAYWEVETGQVASYVLKGQYPWSEQFGAFEASTPLESEPSTLFNTSLALRVLNTNRLAIAGLASSHCVKVSVQQLLSAIQSGVIAKVSQTLPAIELLTDAMQAVMGFEAIESEFFSYAKEQGIELKTTSDY